MNASGRHGRAVPSALAHQAERLGLGALARWLAQERALVERAWREGALVGVLDFASGASAPADLMGLLDAGVAPGVAADACDHACEQALLSSADRLIPVFVDSGAFTEFTKHRPISPGEWERRLGLAERVAYQYGAGAYVVAPDKVGDQATTLERLRVYRPHLERIVARGARLLVPLQRGEVDLDAFAAEVDRLLDPLPWTPAIPFNEVAVPLAELLAFVRRRRPRALHLLGIGRARKEAPDVLDAVREAAPGIAISMDSNKLLAKIGTDVKGGRPLTRAQQEQNELCAETRWADNEACEGEDGEHLGDYTDLIASPSVWLTPKEVRVFCADLQRVHHFSDVVRGRCQADIDEFLQEPMDPDEPESVNWLELAQHEIDALWARYTERESARSRRRKAVTVAFQGAGAPASVPLRDRVGLVRARVDDITAYVTERHYLHRGRKLAQVGYWVVLDAPSAGLDALQEARVQRKPLPERWTLGSVPIHGAILFALPRVSVPRLYGYHPMELLELARLHLEPEHPGGANPKHLASAAGGRALKRVVGDWRNTYPNLPVPKAVVSWADAELHEGAVYKALGFVSLGETAGRGRGSTHKSAAGRSTGTHEDYAHAKHAYILPMVAPDPRTHYYARFVAFGLCEEAALRTIEEIRYRAHAMGLVVPGLTGAPVSAGSERASRRGYTYSPEFNAVEVVLPLLYARGLKAPGQTLQETALTLAAAFEQEAGEALLYADCESDDDPQWEWAIETVQGAKYTRPRSGEPWAVVPVTRSSEPMGQGPIRAYNNPSPRAGARVNDGDAATVQPGERLLPRFDLTQPLSEGRIRMERMVRGLSPEALGSVQASPALPDAWVRTLDEVLAHERRSRAGGPVALEELRSAQLARALGFDELAEWLDERGAWTHAVLHGHDPEDLGREELAAPGRLVVLNMGAGRDSVAMLLLLLEGRLIAHGEPVHVRDVDAVMFADTGAEWDHTILLLERLRSLCARHGLLFLHLRKPPEHVWKPWAEEQRAARQAQGEGWAEVAERELPALNEARDLKLAELRAGKDAEVRELQRTFGKGAASADAITAARDRWNAAIDEVKRAHKAKVARLAAPFRYRAEQASWAYQAQGVTDRADDGSYHLRPPILADFGYKDTIACRDDKSCTANHKVLPLRRATNDLSVRRFGTWADNRGWGEAVAGGRRLPHLNLIGLAADEQDRLSKGGDIGAFSARYVDEAFPLAELGVSKADEEAILARHGFEAVRKSGCWMCPHQPVGWWWALSEIAPERFAAAVDYEARAAARDPGLRIVGREPLRDAVIAWRSRNQDATVEGVLAKTYAKACSRPPAQPNPSCPLCRLRAEALGAAGLAPVLPTLAPGWRRLRVA